MDQRSDGASGDEFASFLLISISMRRNIVVSSRRKVFSTVLIAELSFITIYTAFLLSCLAGCGALFERGLAKRLPCR